VAYPITYASDFTEDRSRLTTFFRIFMVIPHFLVLIAYGIAGFFTVIGAWFAVSFTGRYPQGLYDFNAGLLRYITRLNGYMYLATDVYPPFGTGVDDQYPVRVDVAPAQPSYSRLKAFFRLIVGIPVFVIFYVMQIIFQAVAFISWFWIVVAGKQNAALHGALVFSQGYAAKATGYLYLLTETYPPFDNEPSAVTAGPAASALASPEAPVPAPASERSSLGSDIGLPDLPPPPKRDDKPGGFTSGDPLG